MRIILLCFGLFLAAPVWANSLDEIEETACRTSSLHVARMADSEKLCRSFVRALAGLPEATAEQAQAMLTPENLALMAATTTLWMGSQAVPIVGQAVDAALVTLGVVLLAAQAGEVAHAIWSYVNLALKARSESELDTAASHLSQALVTVGLNVVALVLMKKAAVEKPPPRAPMRFATNEGALLHSTAAPTPTTAPTNVAMAGAKRGSGGRSVARFGTTQLAKALDLKAFAAWARRAPKQPVKENSKALRFQTKHAGPDELLVSGGGEQVWADGASLANARLREVKHVDSPDKSPYVPGSSCDEEIRALIRGQLFDQFRRYAAVIRDEATPAVGLEVITNEARAVPFFELLMREVGLVGDVIVKH